MVSMKKFLLFAILASVLIGAVCVKAQEEPEERKEPAKKEDNAEKADAGTEATEQKPAEAESGHGGVADFGKRIISGFKKAGKTIFSHIPFLSQGAAAGAEKAEEASEGNATTEASAAEEKGEEAKEESKEKSA